MNSDILLSEIENNLDRESIVEKTKILLRQYDVSYNDDKLWNTLKQVFNEQLGEIINIHSQKYVANEIISKLALRYYPGERTVKYHLFKKLSKIISEVTVFELYANNSRIDICRVNGASVAYEIKTELDNYERLSVQLMDYLTIFEKVYVVVPLKNKEKVKGLLPKECGLITYRLEDEKCFFSHQKAASSSPYLSGENQLKNLSSLDLNYIICKSKLKSRPEKKSERLNLILNNLTLNEINRLFKDCIKSKYADKWNFLKENFDDIYPIDIQHFFNTSIEPSLAYYKKINSHLE